MPTCIAVYTSAEFVGLAFLTPLLAWLKVTFGWPAIFFFTGALGLAWSFVFRRAYHDPAEFPGANRAEVELIRSSGGIPDLSSRIAARHAARDGSLWRDFLVVLGRRKLWGIYFGHFAWGTTSTFFLTWFPTYLVTYRHLDFIKAGFYASLPFVGAFAGVLCSGALSDWLYRRGFSLSFARKTPIIGGLALSTSIIGANFVDHPALIILFLSLAFFANVLASIHWSLVSATAPERLIGLTSGVFDGMPADWPLRASLRRSSSACCCAGRRRLHPPVDLHCLHRPAGRLLLSIFVVGKLERVVGVSASYRDNMPRNGSVPTGPRRPAGMMLISWLVGIHQVCVARLVFKQLARAGIGSTWYLGRVWYWDGRQRPSTKRGSSRTLALPPAGLVVQHMHTQGPQGGFPS